MSFAIPQWMKSLFSPVQQCPHQGAINLAYRPDIDGLRALAVLCVVAFHAFPHTLRGGFIGVDIFFVISGYLISSIIVQDLEKGQFSIATFYNRRIRRIFPALILVMLSVMAFGWFALLPDEYKALGKHVFGGSAFISNFILWRESGYFDVASQLKPLLHLWSLGIEEQFYIIFPLILWLCAKYRFRIPTIVAMLCVLSFLDNMYLFRKAPVVDFYSPLSRVWELMAGAVLSTALRHPAIQQGYLRVDAVCAHWMREGETPNDGRSLSLVLAVCGVLLVATGLLLSRQGDAYPGWKALLPVSGAVCLLAAGPANGISKYLLANRLAVFIGLISYPLYLWHWPLLSYAHIIIGDMDSSTRLLRVGLVVGAVVLAALTYFLVERPIRFSGKSYRIAMCLGISMIFIMLISLTVYYNLGFPNRTNIKKYVLSEEQIHSYPSKDNECIKYVNISNEIGYCRYKNHNSKYTIAIIGDSHAHASYYGIEKISNIFRNFNILLLGRIVPADRVNDKNIREKIINYLENNKKIKKVFYITRGSVALTGIHNYTKNLTDFERELSIKYPTPVSRDDFKNEMQEHTTRLVASGKKVYLVSEVPELYDNPREYINRPFRKDRNISQFPTSSKNEVLKRQTIHRQILKEISGATFVDTLDAFCPRERCFVFTQDGIPTRRDDDHLSKKGSEILANDVLKPYLLENVQ